MKFNCIYILVFLVVSSCVNNQFHTRPKKRDKIEKKQNQLMELNLLDSVKSICINKYRVTEKFGEIIKEKKETSVCSFFNRQGFEIKRLYPGIAGKYERKYNYDDKNNLIEELIYENDKLKNKIVFTYSNSNVKLIEECYDHNGKLEYTLIHAKLDNSNNLIEENFYDNVNRALLMRVINKYNNNKLIEKSYYTSAGDLDERIVYEGYDNNGNATLLKRYKSKKELDSESIVKYDEYGYKTEMVNKPFGPFSSFIVQIFYKYDENGNEIEAVRYIKGKPTHKVVYKYDVRGNEISKSDKYWFDMRTSPFRFIYDKHGEEKRDDGSIENYDQNGNLLTQMFVIDYVIFESSIYEYDFDIRGNWIKQIKYLDKKIMFLTEREIEYFN